MDEKVPKVAAAPVPAEFKARALLAVITTADTLRINGRPPVGGYVIDPSDGIRCRLVDHEGISERIHISMECLGRATQHSHGVWVTEDVTGVPVTIAAYRLQTLDIDGLSPERLHSLLQPGGAPSCGRAKPPENVRQLRQRRWKKSGP